MNGKDAALITLVTLAAEGMKMPPRGSGRTDNKQNWADNIYNQIRDLEKIKSPDKYVQKRLEKLRKQLLDVMTERDQEEYNRLAQANQEIPKKD